MSKNAMRLMVLVAITSGLLVAFGIYRILGQGARSRVAELPVAVAKDALKTGTVLTRTNVRMAARPETDVPSGAFESVESLVGRTTRTAVAAGDPIQENQLVPSNESTLRALLKPGYRAIGVFIDARGDVQRLLQVGDRVDVVVTMEDQDNLSSSRVVLQNIEVLVVPPAGQKDPESSYSATEQTQESAPVTLAVTPAEAEKLALAMRVGTIQLLVRGYEDDGQAPTSGVTRDTLLPVTLSPGDASGEDTASTYRQIEVIKGQDRQRQRFMGSHADTRPGSASLPGAGASVSRGEQ